MFFGAGFAGRGEEHDCAVDYPEDADEEVVATTVDYNLVDAEKDGGDVEDDGEVFFYCGFHVDAFLQKKEFAGRYARIGV